MCPGEASEARQAGMGERGREGGEETMIARGEGERAGAAQEVTRGWEGRGCRVWDEDGEGGSEMELAREEKRRPDRSGQQRAGERHIAGWGGRVFFKK